MTFNARALSVGVAGGLAGGLLFGIMMSTMGMMGMSALQIGQTQLQSLMGHVLYGVIAGVVYRRLGSLEQERLSGVRAATSRAARRRGIPAPVTVRYYVRSGQLDQRCGLQPGR